MEPVGNAQIVLVRHGETEWSRDGLHTSVTDVALTPTGQLQARQVGAALAGRHFAVVLTSPRQRARTTAELAGFTDYRVDQNLVEWDYGPFEGKTTPQIAAELGHPWTIWAGSTAGEPVPGESAAEVGARADAVLASLAPQLGHGDAALVFAHAHTLRILAARWLGLSAVEGARFALGTGSISTLGFEHGTRVLQRWNLQP